MIAQERVVCVNIIADMEISYLGGKSFKLKNKNITLLIDPSNGKEKADVVVYSDERSAKPTIVSVVRSEVFEVNLEGEYEIGGVGIIADKFGQYRVSYVFMDGVRVGHLLASNEKLSDKQVEKLNDCDVILVDVACSSEFIGPLEPYIFIPMGEKDEVERFLSENKFATVVRDLDKAKLDQDSLPDETQVWVLNA